MAGDVLFLMAQVALQWSMFNQIIKKNHLVVHIFITFLSIKNILIKIFIKYFVPSQKITSGNP